MKLHAFLIGIRWRGVISFILLPVYPQDKKPEALWQETGWFRLVLDLRRREKSLSSPVTELRSYI